MQTEQKQVVHELTQRLRIDGKWYGRGDAVLLPAEDADIYMMRGISKVADPKAAPKNTIKAALVPLQAKSNGDVQVPVKKDDDEAPAPVKKDETPKARDAQPARRSR